MDSYILLISVILGLLYFQSAHGTLRCVQCDHIGWNQTYNFEGVEHIYKMLESKYNPACAQQDPNSRNMYLLNQQQQQQQQSGQFAYNTVGETVCPVVADVNRCNYIFGDAIVFFPNYNAKMRLNMHVRNCEDVAPELENRCYHRDTNLGYYQVKNFIQDQLAFLGSVNVEHFLGQQCYCTYNLCYPYIDSGRSIVASTLSVFLAFVLTFLLR